MVSHIPLLSCPGLIPLRRHQLQGPQSREPHSGIEVYCPGFATLLQARVYSKRCVTFAATMAGEGPCEIVRGSRMPLRWKERAPVNLFFGQTRAARANQVRGTPKEPFFSDSNPTTVRATRTAPRALSRHQGGRCHRREAPGPADSPKQLQGDVWSLIDTAMLRTRQPSQMNATSHP